jgi:hypothetical protein
MLYADRSFDPKRDSDTKRWELVYVIATLTKIILEHVGAKWGVPLRIVFDKGAQFVGEAYKKMCEMLEITSICLRSRNTTNKRVARAHKPNGRTRAEETHFGKI